jgi:hypothetical protein
VVLVVAVLELREMDELTGSDNDEAHRVMMAVFKRYTSRRFCLHFL